MWRDIKSNIASHQNFILTTHVNPDGDGIGAACAMTEMLLQMGKKVRFVCDSPIPRKYAFLDFHKTFSHIRKTEITVVQKYWSFLTPIEKIGLADWRAL